MMVSGDRQIQGLLPILSLTYYLKVTLLAEHQHQPLTNNFVIIGN